MEAKAAEGRAAKRYMQLCNDREPYLRRARKFSELTIPSLIPPDGFTGTDDLYTPFQNVGASGLRNLSSKIMRAIMPVGQPMFRQRPNEAALAELEAQDEEIRLDTEIKLARYERSATNYIEQSGDRAAVAETVNHLLVAGNVAFDMSEETSRTIPLSNYVVVRNGRGTVLEAVICEEVDPAEVSIKEPTEETPKLYTHIERTKKHYTIYQELDGKVVSGSRGSYPHKKLPFLFLRFIRVDGQSYGRSFGDETIGDLTSLEALSQAIVEGAAAAAKVVILVRPNGSTSVKVIRDADNLAVVEGSADDVTMLSLDKQTDFQVAKAVADQIEKRLGEQFLLHSAVTRDAERVTAEEIRLLASELNDNHAGIYSVLSNEFQLPYVTHKIEQAVRQKKLPRLPQDAVDTVIVTGLEALGRTHDLQNLDMFVERMLKVLGPEMAAQIINLEVYARSVASMLGVDQTSGLIRKPEEVQQQNMMSQIQGIAQGAGPGVIQEIVKNASSAQAGAAPDAAV